MTQDYFALALELARRHWPEADRGLRSFRGCPECHRVAWRDLAQSDASVEVFVCAIGHTQRVVRVEVA